jgi:hypothetical protein
MPATTWNFWPRRVKNPRPENVGLNGPRKRVKCESSDPGVVGAMEYWNDGLELSEGFCKDRRLHKSVLSWTLYTEYPVRFFPLFQSSTPPALRAQQPTMIGKAIVSEHAAGRGFLTRIRGLRPIAGNPRTKLRPPGGPCGPAGYYSLSFAGGVSTA